MSEFTPIRFGKVVNVAEEHPVRFSIEGVSADITGRRQVLCRPLSCVRYLMEHPHGVWHDVGGLCALDLPLDPESGPMELLESVNLGHGYRTMFGEYGVAVEVAVYHHAPTPCVGLRHTVGPMGSSAEAKLLWRDLTLVEDTGHDAYGVWRKSLAAKANQEGK